MKVITDYAFTIPTENGGLSKNTAADVSEWATRGYFPVDDTANPKFDAANGPSTIEVDQFYCNFDQMYEWCTLGQEIENYLIYHELNDLTKTVPAAYSDLYGEPTDTWVDWGVIENGSHAPIQIGSLWYRSSLYGNAGTPLPASSFYDFTRNPNTNQTGIVRMLTVDEFQQIQADANPEP